MKPDSTKRIATHPGMIANDRVGTRNKSGVKGVYFDKRRNKWAAEITCQRVKYHLGRFNTKDEAVNARQIARERYLLWYADAHPDRQQAVGGRCLHGA